MIEIVRGNRKTLKWGLRVDGQYLTSLGEATKITFAIKEKHDDANADALLFIEWLSGGSETRIVLDDPETGWVKVTMLPSDTTLKEGKYFYALQVEWAADNKLEFVYGDGILRVKPDVIR